jgi:poly(A)-specific ribonuclease
MLRLSTNIDAKEQIINPHADSNVKIAKGDSLIDGRERVQYPVPLPPVKDEVRTSTVGEEQSHWKIKQKKKKKKKRAAQAPQDSKYASKNQFENLGSLEKDSTADSEIEGPWEDTHISDQTKEYPINKMKREPMEMIPKFDDEFWAKFGNRLRIFGTQESVLQIAEWVKPERKL